MLSIFDEVVKLSRQTRGGCTNSDPGFYNFQEFIGTAYITERQSAVFNSDNKNEIDVAMDNIFRDFNTIPEANRKYNIPIVDITNIRFITNSENSLDKYVGRCIFFSNEVDVNGNEIHFSKITNQINRQYLMNYEYTHSDNSDKHIYLSLGVGQTDQDYKILIKSICNNVDNEYSDKIITTTPYDPGIYGYTQSKILPTLSGIFILARNPDISVGFNDYELLAELFRKYWKPNVERVVYDSYYWVQSPNTILKLEVEKDDCGGRFFKIPAGAYISEKNLVTEPNVIPGIFGNESIQLGRTSSGKTPDFKDFLDQLISAIFYECENDYRNMTQVINKQKAESVEVTLYSYLKEKYQ